MHGQGEDWSQLPNSKRSDRPLTREQLRELTAKSDFKGFVQLFGSFALCGATGYGILAMWELLPTHWMQVWPLLVLAGLSIWQGFLLSALGFAAQHECLHYTAFRTRWLNGFVGRLVSVPSYAFYLQEKAMHKEHHTFTQDLHRDPELIAEVAGCTYAGGASGLPEGVDLAAVAAAGRNGFKKVPMDRSQYFERFTNLYGYLDGKLKKFYYCAQGIPVDYSSDGWLLEHCPPGEKLTKDLQTEARVQIVVTLALMAAWPFVLSMESLVLTWLVPSLLGPPCLYFVQMHEHANCALDPNGLSNTRTTLTNPIINFVMWNMSYHSEHHLYTLIPFHSLPKAHTLLKEHIINVSDGHINVHKQVLSSWITEQHDALMKGKEKAAKAA